MDPYGVLAILGFLVFLFYIIYNFLNATGNASTGKMFYTVDDLLSSLGLFVTWESWRNCKPWQLYVYQTRKLSLRGE